MRARSNHPRLRHLPLLAALSLLVCAEPLVTAAAGANILAEVSEGSLYYSTPGRSTRTTGDPAAPTVALAHDGTGPVGQLTHRGSGSGLVVEVTGDDAPAIEAVAAGGPAARLRGRLELAGDGAVLVMPTTTLPAADDLRVPDGASVVVIEATTGAQANALALPPGRDGQALWIYNADDDPLSFNGAAIDPDAGVQLLFLAGGWRRFS
ncbi:MAG: hypothetical protein R3A79_21700 [Nannocystaceae bacterium]